MIGEKSETQEKCYFTNNKINSCIIKYRNKSYACRLVVVVILAANGMNTFKPAALKYTKFILIEYNYDCKSLCFIYYPSVITLLRLYKR